MTDDLASDEIATDWMSQHEKRVDDVRSEVARQTRAGVSQAAIARAAGLSRSALSEFLAGKYKGDEQAVVRKLERWLDRRPCRSPSTALNDRLGLAHWVDTPTYLEIRRALRFAHVEPSIVLVYGGSGVGKTTAINAHRYENDDVFVITGSPSSGSLLATIHALANVVPNQTYYAKPQPSARADTVSRWLRTILANVPSRRGLIVIDEAQHMQPRALEELRLLHDDVGVGVVLCGNDWVYKNMDDRVAGAAFVQLKGRIGLSVTAHEPSGDDVRTILAELGIAGSQELKVAIEIARNGKGLRGLLNAIFQARQVAEGGPITAELIHQAGRAATVTL